MTIDELIERLEEYRDDIGGDAEVRLMTQQQLAVRERHLRPGVRRGDQRRGRRRRPERRRRRRRRTTWSTSAKASSSATERSGPGRSPTEAETPDRGRRGGWFPPPDDGSPTIANVFHEEPDHGNQEDHDEEGTTAKKTAGAKAATKKATPKKKASPKAKAASGNGEAKAKKLSALDAAAKVLAETKQPMNYQGDDRGDGRQEALDQPRRQDAARHAVQRHPARDQHQGQRRPLQEDRTRQVRRQRLTRRDGLPPNAPSSPPWGVFSWVALLANRPTGRDTATRSWPSVANDAASKCRRSARISSSMTISGKALDVRRR